MKTFHFLILFTCCLIISACQPNHQKDLRHDGLEQLLHLMSGEFNSLKQSESDENYYHISLKMKPIWSANPAGKWLYVEQAVGHMPDKPYRQRIYHVTALNSGTYSSEVYELPDPKAVIGAYNHPELLASLSPKDLNLRAGCAVVIKQIDNQSYSGSTNEKSCLSKLRGATYATSQVQISASGISSWDQGFDAKDVQVWGATEGPYVFDRQ